MVNVPSLTSVDSHIICMVGVDIRGSSAAAAYGEDENADEEQ